MKYSPMLFSAPMVRALINGCKTQTRRAVKTQLVIGHESFVKPIRKGHSHVYLMHRDFDRRNMVEVCPYGQPGDHLWVRETFCPIYPQDPAYNDGLPIEYDYRATYQHGYRLGDSLGIPKKWKPAIHMPRLASRIELEVTDVRVERLQDISSWDAIAEGIESHLEGWRDYLDPSSYSVTPANSYRTLWEAINGSGSWDQNPWVWAIDFKVVKP